MKLSKKLVKKLVLWTSVLVVVCVGAVWTSFIYRANKSIDQLKSNDWQVREEAVKSLIKLGKPAVDPLITALKDDDGDIRCAAAFSLGYIGDRRAIKPLVNALKDEDSRVKHRAIEALGRIADMHCVEPLIGTLNDEDIYVQNAVVNALVKIGKPAVGPLITALKDEDSRARYKAIEILGEIGDSRAVEPLITALENKNLDKSKVIWALERITGENFGRDPKKWQNWWEENKDRYSTQK